MGCNICLTNLQIVNFIYKIIILNLDSIATLKRVDGKRIKNKENKKAKKMKGEENKKRDSRKFSSSVSFPSIINTLFPVDRLLLRESPFFIFCIEILDLRKRFRA